jgi:hypothetical protein
MLVRTWDCGGNGDEIAVRTEVENGGRNGARACGSGEAGVGTYTDGGQGGR